jgi:hypothetical protein
MLDPRLWASADAAARVITNAGAAKAGPERELRRRAPLHPSAFRIGGAARKAARMSLMRSMRSGGSRLLSTITTCEFVSPAVALVRPRKLGQDVTTRPAPAPSSKRTWRGAASVNGAGERRDQAIIEKAWPRRRGPCAGWHQLCQPRCYRAMDVR